MHALTMIPGSTRYVIRNPTGLLVSCYGKAHPCQDGPVLHTPVEVRFSVTRRFVHGQGKRGNAHIPAMMSVAFPDVVVFDGSFSCGIVYSRGNRTPESEKNQTSVYLIKRKMKKKILYTYRSCLLYTSPSPRDGLLSRMPSSA